MTSGRLSLPKALGLSASMLSIAAATVVPAFGAGNATWPYQIYKTANFTPPWLNITSHYKPSEGYLFVAPDGGTDLQMAPLIMDMQGELVWNGPKTHAFAFGTQNYLGEDVLVYWNGTAFPEPVGRGNGAIYLLNKHYESITEVTLGGNWLELTPGATYPSNIDLHEINLTKNGSVLVTANNVTQFDLTSVGGPADGWIVDCFVYEIDIATNEVLFEWSALDHVDQLPLTYSVYPLGSDGFNGTSQSTAWGWFHINAVDRFEDGYIMSSRFLCSAIAIGGDGHVKWRLQGRDGGDFTLGEGADFCFQHDIRAIPEQPHGSVFTLNMFDNANSPIENNTTPNSGKSLSVDLASKHVTLKQRYLNESGPIFATAQGDLQPLPDGNVFLGHGWIPIAEEYSQGGRILSTIQYGAAVPRSDGGFVSGSRGTLSYRSFKQPWIGCPRTPPAVVAEAERNGVAVYVSWNGATEVELWSIYAGTSNGTLSHVKTVSKAGFETDVRIGKAKYVQVKPVFKSARTECEACGYDQEMASDVVAVCE